MGGINIWWNAYGGMGVGRGSGLQRVTDEDTATIPSGVVIG